MLPDLQAATSPHPVAGAVQQAMQLHKLTPQFLGRMVDAREADMPQAPYATIQVGTCPMMSLPFYLLSPYAGWLMPHF